MTMKDFDLPANFLSYLDTGKLSVTCNDSPAVNFHADGSTKIIDVIESGYMLGDKIIRYPKVVIGQ